MKIPSMFLTLTLLLAPLGTAAQDEGPARSALSAAERYVSEFEMKVKRADGAPFKPGHDAQEAMRRVAALRESHPDDPRVHDLFNRVRAALLASRGTVFEITPEMVAYREAQEQVVERLAGIADQVWTELLEAHADQRLDGPPLPAPDPQTVSVDALRGKTVLLEGLIDYPARQFTSAGKSWLAVGTPSEGFWFINLSGRGWATAYRALREYQSQVSADTNGPWSLVGTVEGIDLMVPDASAESIAVARFGWVVEPVALQVPGRTVALAASENGAGRFAGETDLESMKSAYYSVHEVPEDAAPIDVMRAYIAAIKERNWTLYMSLIHDSWKETDRSRERLRYYWDITQRRLRDLYVHAEPDSIVSDVVIQGERASDLESLFLSDADQATLAARSKPLIEQATVRILRFDERGVQVEPDNRIPLRREASGPWKIYGPWPL